ncbi:MAG: 3-isopropylmalate dehydrogenase [Peptococcia bacterium]
MYKIAVLPGDGIGPEITEQALGVLELAAAKYNLNYTVEEGLIGGAAYDVYGEPFPQETRELVSNCDAVLLGAVGGPQYDQLPVDKRPEKGLLQIRKALGLYANLRPIKCWPQLMDQSPFKNERINGVDLLIVRELIGGAYFGARGTDEVNGELAAFDTIEYTSSQIRRVVRRAFELAKGRRRMLTSVDKANVLDTSRLWRKIVLEEARKFPEVTVNHLYVDNCAMQLCINPGQFDVLVTENMFGDILSDQASVLGASLGMLASASLGDGKALYEPAHGSAPDIAGQGKANPLAAILSVAMLLRITMKSPSAASAVENGVQFALEQGLRTADIYTPGTTLATTESIGNAVKKKI